MRGDKGKFFEMTKEDRIRQLKNLRKQSFEDYLFLIKGGALEYEADARKIATQYNLPVYRISKAIEEGKKNKQMWDTLPVKPEMPRISPAKAQENFEEYQIIARTVKEDYDMSDFKNEKDESAFLLLAMNYLGRDAEGKHEPKISSLNMRKISGDQIFDSLYRNDQLTHEGKARIESLWEGYYVILEGLTDKKPKTISEKPVNIEHLEKRVKDLAEEIKRLIPK